MSALYTALLEGETKESLALMVCGLREQRSALHQELEAERRELAGLREFLKGTAQQLLARSLKIPT